MGLCLDTCHMVAPYVWREEGASIAPIRGLLYTLSLRGTLESRSRCRGPAGPSSVARSSGRPGRGRGGAPGPNGLRTYCARIPELYLSGDNFTFHTQSSGTITGSSPSKSSTSGVSGTASPPRSRRARALADFGARVTQPEPMTRCCCCCCIVCCCCCCRRCSSCSRCTSLGGRSTASR